MMSLDNPVGRLLNVRLTDPVSLQEMQNLGFSLPRALQKLQPKRGIICADFSGLAVLSPEVGDAWVSLARNDNPMMECSALLLPTSPLMKMQMLRLIKEAGSPSRRTFQNSSELSAWLSGVLDLEEGLELATFLGGAKSNNP